jgi:hypothetical protein
MPVFRDQEKKRLASLKSRLFSPEACSPGIYKDQPRDFALGNGRASENLWEGIRTEALDYFTERRISWHDGIEEETDSVSRRGPSNHLCCSQSNCVNVWYPYVRKPQLLLSVLRGIGYDAVEVLPVTLDQPLANGELPFVGFEWIGARNYLGEGPGGRPTPEGSRARGKNATSADMIVRFRDSGGHVQIVLGEWKYTEEYASGKSKQVSERGTDRLRTYAPLLQASDCQIRGEGLQAEDLFYDPFDQLMRLQLLASAMEREHEMEADVVSTLHMAPAANEALMRRITSPALRSHGSNIHEVWTALVPNGRFRGIYTEELLPIMLAHAPDPQWRDYMAVRYGRQL